MREHHLRTRVLLLTGAFTLVLFAVTFGLSWKARNAQQRWNTIIRVETEAIAQLDRVIAAQNAFNARYLAGSESADRYRIVTQLFDEESLQKIDAPSLRARLTQYEAVLGDPATPPQQLEQASFAAVGEAQRVIDERKAAIRKQLDALERESGSMMSTGLAIAWIIALISFAIVQTTLRKVVKPVEDLSAAARRISAGELSARAPVGGDVEIATLGRAFNKMADELSALARTDGLTSLPNFRAFTDRINEELDRADRYPNPFGILILDLDFFKKYNDTHGHQAGNDALKRVAQSIRETVRSVDFPARYGGEEFAVILPQVDTAALLVIAERIRTNIEALPAPADGSKVTVSIGAAIYPVDGTGRETLFQRADERLYEAKKLGRNCVVAGSREPARAARSAAPQSA